MHDLLGAMPHDAAWRRAVAGKTEDQWAAMAPWGPAEHLLAYIADVLGQLLYVTARVNGARDARAPEPIPRPTLGGAQAEPARKIAAADEILAFVQRRKAG